MEKNSYIAIQVKEDEKLYAYVMKLNNSYNLIGALEIKNIITANICDTKKKAEEIVAHWNECFKRNGTYMFTYPQF